MHDERESIGIPETQIRSFRHGLKWVIQDGLITGVPDKTTTEVTTKLLVEDGQAIFIGGLIQNSTSYSREGVPYLSEVPLLGGLFANNSDSSSVSETIIIITPRIINNARESLPGYEKEYLDESSKNRGNMEKSLDKSFGVGANG